MYLRRGKISCISNVPCQGSWLQFSSGLMGCIWFLLKTEWKWNISFTEYVINISYLRDYDLIEYDFWSSISPGKSQRHVACGWERLSTVAVPVLTESRGEGKTSQLLRELLPSAPGLPAEQGRALGGMRRRIDPESHTWLARLEQGSITGGQGGEKGQCWLRVPTGLQRVPALGTGCRVLWAEPSAHSCFQGACPAPGAVRDTRTEPFWVPDLWDPSYSTWCHVLMNGVNSGTRGIPCILYRSGGKFCGMCWENICCSYKW